MLAIEHAGPRAAEEQARIVPAPTRPSPPRRGRSDRGWSGAHRRPSVWSVKGRRADRSRLFRGEGVAPQSVARDEVAPLPRRTPGRKVLAFRQHVPDGCPPTDCAEADGEFYRLVFCDPVAESDFLSFWELCGAPQGGNPCESAGLSMCVSREDIERTKKINGRLANAKIALGTLVPEMGVTRPSSRPSRPTHTTYWPYMTAEPWLHFVVVEDADDG